MTTSLTALYHDKYHILSAEIQNVTQENVDTNRLGS